jgi:hypothetical protein
LPVPPAIIAGADVTSIIAGPASLAAAITERMSSSFAPAIHSSS